MLYHLVPVVAPCGMADMEPVGVSPSSAHRRLIDKLVEIGVADNETGVALCHLR